MNNNNKEELIEKRDEFIFEVCKYIASTLLDIENNLWDKVPSSKRSSLKTEQMKLVLAKMLQEKFNDIFSLILDKKPLSDNFIKLTKYFNHSKLGLLHLLGPTCVSVHMSINRSLLETKTLDEYKRNIGKLVNDKLNDEYYNITTKFIEYLGNGEWTDDLIDDDEFKKNRKPFNFKVEIER
jgi:hypothetical protein